MAKRKAEQDVRDDPRYHDTRKLLRKYRDVTWSLELSVQRLKNQFHVEYGTDIEGFLDSVYLAGLTWVAPSWSIMPSALSAAIKCLPCWTTRWSCSALGTRTVKSTIGCCITPTCRPSSSRIRRKSSNNSSHISGISVYQHIIVGRKKRLRH